MKVNETTALVAKDVILVPYRKEHVEKYHEWMKDEELRELTASEALTLDEEYEMQRKWQEDEDKLTFIVLARGMTTDCEILDECKSSQMIGDVNLFFKGDPSDDDFEVEAEIMIAEKAFRRKGLASQALQAILSYAISARYPPLLPLSPAKFVVRIGDSNEPSIKMFERLGFAITKRVEVFQEVEMRLSDPQKSQQMWEATQILDYK
ncbi:acyl-CoA N-acyltransferase [Schizopora paradoxa]|uniref:Acyl-CoA N-acyltransferase n=1 Tax=Schizopora paradoxa TaxID=27342 RepID=A0A0H2SL63_9AGAM|nr:acyl-CoA N-acyltransferase [Schizopora paradoxa]